MLLSITQLVDSEYKLRNSAPLYALDPEIEKTFHRLRKMGNTTIADSSSSDSILNSENSNFSTEESHFYEYQET
ncbi:hypothetical protein CR513_10630, partial [Mucuna pruriens]